MKIHPIDNRWHNDMHTFEEMVHGVMANLKIIYGALNNCIFLHIGDALMKVEKLKLTGNDKRFTKKIWQEWHSYEANLKYGDMRYFDTNDIGEYAKAQMKEGMTIEEYFDFWTATGFRPYKMTLPLVGCLSNKYKLLIERNGVKQPENKAPMMTVLSLLEVALETHKQCVNLATNHLAIRHSDMEQALAPFSLRRVRDAWWHCMRNIIPELRTITPTELEQKNIDMTLHQLAETMSTTDFMFNGMFDATATYDELFKGDGLEKTLADLKEAKKYFDNFKN